MPGGRATLRAGAGLTVVATPAGAAAAVSAQLLEVMCAPLPDRDGHLGLESIDRVLAESRRASAVALGPGLGRAEATTAAVHELIDRLALPLVLDADGLWHLADAPEGLQVRSAPTVITPHAGEAARLLGVDRHQVEADRLASAWTLAERSGAVVVLKGAGTIVAAPGCAPSVSSGGSAALATAGTGDVLTGTVAAFLSKGMEPHAAAIAAVAAHARAGELADRGDGTIASDVLEALPPGPGREPPVSATRAVADIDLSAVRHNAATLARAAGSARLMAVVKAEGYGHGAVPVARAALEGGRRRPGRRRHRRGRSAPGRRTSTTPILVMGPLRDDEWARAAAAGVEITAWTPSAVESARAAFAATGRPARVHLKLDTGMGRLGARPEDVAALAEAAASAGERRGRGRPDDALRHRRRDARARTPGS